MSAWWFYCSPWRRAKRCRTRPGRWHPWWHRTLRPIFLRWRSRSSRCGGGGGGGDRSPTPASKGRLPKPSLKQFTPPMAVVNNPNPKLVMDPTIIAPPDTPLPNVNMPVWGDPLAKIGPPSNGPGSGGGIGSGSGGGVGSGKGGGIRSRRGRRRRRRGVPSGRRRFGPAGAF